tara:strand:- start:467 stop:889 length:423 start_codon:yes stop_codon:yes gene_type:complete
MNKIVTILLILSLNTVFAMDNHNHNHGKHNDNDMHEHTNDTIIGDPQYTSKELYNSFVANLVDSQVAVVDVNGMVCDFCARGIEKTFYKDKDVKKVNVSLENGIVLIAYKNSKNINIEEIKNIFLANGQTANKVTVKKIL